MTSWKGSTTYIRMYNEFKDYCIRLYVLFLYTFIYFIELLFDFLLQSVKLIWYVTACTDLGFYLAAGLVMYVEHGAWHNPALCCICCKNCACQERNGSVGG